MESPTKEQAQAIIKTLSETVTQLFPGRNLGITLFVRDDKEISFSLSNRLPVDEMDWVARKAMESKYEFLQMQKEN